MTGFLRSFYSLEILSDRSVTSVAFHAAYKVVQLGMLGLVDESYSVIEILAEHSDASGPLTEKIPDVAQFLYETANKLPDGVERLDKEGLNSLEKESLRKIPYIPDGVDIANGSNEDFEALKSRLKELEADSENSAWLDATTGYNAMRLSGSLAGLLNLALRLNKAAEADEVMARIASRIHANQQSQYLADIRPAWGKYFLSGWLRDKLGISEHDLKEYAEFIRETIKKRLEEGPVRPRELFKDQSFEEMLEELDKNTLRFKRWYEELLYESDGDDEKNSDDESKEGNKEEQHPSKKQKYTVPKTILRKPATTEQIAAAESKLGRPLPDDLKDFYALTNGTRLVICAPGVYILRNRLPKVQSLFWEDDSYMSDYTFELLPGEKLPMSVDWPGIEGGAIAMYEDDGQGTEYVWYINGELLAKAKKVLDEAYQKAEEAEKKVLDSLVKAHHGSWEQLRDLQACWYQQGWGDPDGMFIFHDFRDFLSSVLYESKYEEDRSPLKGLPRYELYY